MKFITIASLGLAAIVSAQTTTESAAPTSSPTGLVGCAKSDAACRYAPDANQAQCSANQAQCQTACSDAHSKCQTAPDANEAACAGDFATCLGENPYASNGTLTLSILGSTPSATVDVAAASTSDAAASTVSPTGLVGCAKSDAACRYAPDANQAQCSANQAQCQTACSNAHSQCQVAPNANQAQCAADFASCLGENPYASNGTLTLSILGSMPSSTGASGVVYTTEVVTALTTYCPASTQLTYNNNVYTVSSATTLTITDCPCTVTKPVSGASTMATATGVSGAGNATASVSMPATYTGAAANIQLTGAASGLVAAVAGAIIFL